MYCLEIEAYLHGLEHEISVGMRQTDKPLKSIPKSAEF